jgi:peptide/nickel transport system substrate-binding protein
VALASYAHQLAYLTPEEAAAAQATTEALPGTMSELGRLVGTLEGPEIILDPALIPTSFNEAPMLAEMVAAGTLPAVDKRLPFVPMVIKPLESVGAYGGTWRRGFTGPGDYENGNRIVSTDKILFWDYTGTQIRPSIAKDWEISDDGRVTTIYLREGMRWSDGEPFTADDFMFWYEDMYQDTNVVPAPTPELSINGKPGVMAKEDDYAVSFTFEDPYYLFVDILAGSTLIGGGQATRQSRGIGMGAYAPAHYLKQFLPKYSSEDELNKMATDEGFDGWVSLLKFKMDWGLNPDLPTLTPWKTTVPINQPTWVLERNPYYWAVDTEGNQLPYLDKIVMTLAENLEVLNLRAVAGEYDEQERHTALTNLPVFLENQEASGYTVHLDPAFNGLDSTLHVNQSYEADDISRPLLLTQPPHDPV